MPPTSPGERRSYSAADGGGARPGCRRSLGGARRGHRLASRSRAPIPSPNSARAPCHRRRRRHRARRLDRQTGELVTIAVGCRRARPATEHSVARRGRRRSRRPRSRRSARPRSSWTRHSHAVSPLTAAHRGRRRRDGVLQQPSAEADAVTLATATELVRVPFGGGDDPTVERGRRPGRGGGAGVPRRAARTRAWSGSPLRARLRRRRRRPQRGIEGADATSELQFRVNRDVVVLNDVIGGAAWMASDSMQRVDNWNDLTPPEGEAEEDEETTEETVETTLPERSEENTSPIATDDDFGVRPGRTTVLPVLDNDTDADGDVLVATAADGDPALGRSQPIHNGAALQIAVPEDASGATLSPTRWTTDAAAPTPATVRLDVHEWDQNAGPKQNAHDRRDRRGRGRRVVQRAARLDRPRRRRRLPQVRRAGRGRRGRLHVGRADHLPRDRRRRRAARMSRSSSRTARRTPPASSASTCRPSGRPSRSPTPTTSSCWPGRPSPSRRSPTTPARGARRCA